MDSSIRAVLKRLGVLEEVQAELAKQTPFISNDELIDLWINSQNSDITKRTYRNNLRFFRKYMGNEKHLLQVTRNDIESYFNYLNSDQEIGKYRKLGLFNSVRSFYKFIYDQSKFNERVPPFENPLPEIRKRWKREETGERSNKNIRLSVEEIKKLLHKVKETNFRDYLILFILADTGCRAGGLVNLKIKNIHLEERYFITKEKNSGNNRYCFGETLQRELSIYLNLIKEIEFSPYVFTGQRKPQTSDRTIWRKINIYSKKILKKAISAHTFRRSFGTNRRLQGQAKDIIKRLLNHKINDSTEAYMPVEHLRDFDAYEFY